MLYQIENCYHNYVPKKSKSHNVKKVMMLLYLPSVDKYSIIGLKSKCLSRIINNDCFGQIPPQNLQILDELSVFDVTTVSEDPMFEVNLVWVDGVEDGVGETGQTGREYQHFEVSEKDKTTMKIDHLLYFMIISINDR